MKKAGTRKEGKTTLRILKYKQKGKNEYSRDRYHGGKKARQRRVYCVQGTRQGTIDRFYILSKTIQHATCHERIISKISQGNITKGVTLGSCVMEPEGSSNNCD
jgi:hypothetical protein